MPAVSTLARAGLSKLTRAVAACLICSCSVHGIVHAPGPSAPPPGDPRTAALQAAFAVPEVASAALRAPLGLTTSDGSGLAITSLTARAHVHGPLVETELTLTFVNPEPRTREGRFRIALPQHAFVSRLAMKIDGRLREADVAETSRAREVYDDIVHRRRDPLLVEQHGSSELSARVFPIDPYEEKVIVIGWIAEVSAESPVTIPLHGLPPVGRLDVLVDDPSGRLAAVQPEGSVVPEDIRVSPRSPASSLRAGDLFAARVTIPVGAGASQPIGAGLVVLVDTSASRAPELEADLRRVGEVVAVLAASEPNAKLTVAAFDQSVEVVYRGSLAGYGVDASARLRAHGALGASDLAGAVRWSAREAHATGASRALLVGDGLATAGTAGAEAMRAAARSLRDAGVVRLDAIAEGDVRDEGTMRTLAVGVFSSDGVVVDASLPADKVASRMTRSVLAPLAVSVRGARWVWPSSLRGAQPGEERVVFAELPASVAPHILLGDVAAPAGQVDAAPAAGALLDRTIARAKVESLVEQGDREGFTDALRAKIVTLAKAKRVPSPFTSFLVVESEADRAALRGPRLRAPAARDDLFDLAPPLPPPAPATPTVHLAPARSYTPKPVSLRMGSVQVNGRLPPEIIQRVVRQSWGRFRACYDDGVRRRGPTLAGRVATKFVIGLDGHVSAAVNAESDIADDTMVACVTDIFASLEFSEPAGGVVTVVYPFVFRPAGTEEEETPKAPAPDVRQFPWAMRPFDPAPAPAPALALAWTGDYAEARAAFAKSDLQRAFAVAAAARVHDPQDVLALLALGEAYDRAGLTELAARAFGSIADLRPTDASMLRVAAAHLERVGAGVSALALELHRRAAEDRPDHPHGQHAYAMALLRAGAHEEAFDVLSRAIALPYAPRFVNARLVLEDDLVLVGAAWRTADLARALWIDARTAALTGPARFSGPHASFVLGWETDMSDVELYVRDSDRAKELIGLRRASASEGYGPEAVALAGARGVRPTGRLAVRLARKGPMGYVIGVVHVIDHDGLGHVSVGSRPFVAMNEGVEIDLGAID